jgi:hypothetical protein
MAYILHLNTFFRGAEGQLIQAHWDDLADWEWNNHGPPPGTQMASAPAAVSWQNNVPATLGR